MALAYRELVVWQRSYRLAREVLDVASREPLARNFYFKDQISRCAMSVAANIAEGNGRSTPLDYAAFLDRARGSLFELDTWLLAAKDSGYIDQPTQTRLELEVDALSGMIFSMARSLRARASLPSRTGGSV